MKKVFLLSLILAITISLNAQTSVNKWGIGAGAGTYGTLNNGGIGIMPELYLSRYLNSRLDLMYVVNMGIFRKPLTSNLDLVNSFLNLRLKLTDESKNFRPFLFAGPGFLADNGTKAFNFDLGLGAKYYMDYNTAFYLQAGYIYGLESTTYLGVTGRESLWKVTAGIETDFGKIKDADLDGVSDKKDKCPDTPTGVAVDANGCPIDTDSDGVADYIDDCPTVAGITSLKGCPDKDKDGIADKDDSCPDVAGLANLKGCPDADVDGIADKDDKCPNTKKGYKVDAGGCPFDKDKDGIIDEEDDCPTVAGPNDNKGCPVVVKEEVKKKEILLAQVELQNIKVQPVHFLSGKSYLTEYSKNVLAKLIKTLNSNPLFNANVYGFADSQGSEDFNINLSQERVDSVVKYLISKGLSPDRFIQQKAFGESKPAASNKTAEGRLQNRRVEFEIFKMR